MNWKYKACLVLFVLFVLVRLPIAIAQTKPMKQSAKLRESFEQVKRTARWAAMKPEERQTMEKNTQDRIRQLESEEAATETVHDESATMLAPFVESEPGITQKSRTAQDLYNNFQKLKQTSYWQRWTPKERAEQTKLSLDAYRKKQEMEGTAETPNVKQIESLEMHVFSATNPEFSIFIYATIFAAVFLTFRYLSRDLSVKSMAVCSSSKQALSPKAENMVVCNDVCGNEAYAQALSEIEDNIVDKGLWAKYFAETDGDESRTRARYLKNRAEIIGKQSAMVKIEATNQHNLKSEQKNEAGEAQPYEYPIKMAVLKAVGYIIVVYVVSLLAFFSKFPEFKDVGYLIRFFAMAFGSVAVLKLSNLIRLGTLTTIVLTAFPIIGWGLIIYFAHQENRPPRNS